MSVAYCNRCGAGLRCITCDPPAVEAIVKEARRLIKRSAEITEAHPAYGLLVMAIPLARALAQYDAAQITHGSAPRTQCCERDLNHDGDCDRHPRKKST